MSMFCYQCQETAKNQGCEIIGVCGKNEEIAELQDLLIYLLKGISIYGVKARALGITDEETDLFVVKALFSTITNVSFDPQRAVALIQRALELRSRLSSAFTTAYQQFFGVPHTEPLPDMATWYSDGGLEEFEHKGAEIGLLATMHPNEDIRSLRELLIYGLKGLAAYLDHAIILGYNDPNLLVFLQEALAATADDHATIDELYTLAMRCGENGVKVMALLDKANTETFGTPEPTWVNIGVEEGPGILVSGHDLLDLKELLQQTAGTGIKIYTHGEMLPAHAYPELKAYPHLVGNYGGAWWAQHREFEQFNGPILMTTNCIQKPLSSYNDRIFTTGLVGWPDIPHIPERQPGQQKDFSALIQRALTCDSPTQLETGTIPVGFAHATVLSVADKVIDAVKSGAIQRFVVMAGCDGRNPSREYYTDVARSLPSDTIILTAGCAKYRYNKLPLGDIAGIPRVLDAGQCNDSYSLVVVALKLAEAFGVNSVNDLPVSFDISWYEQKAVLVLLALLWLNVKNIRLGPTLPAFISPNVLNILVELFDIKPIGSVEADVEAMLAGY